MSLRPWPWVSAESRPLGRSLGAGARLLLWAALALTGLTASAEAAECPSSTQKKYQMDLRIETPPPRLHRNRNIEELGRIYAHDGTSQILGVANTGLDFGWEVTFKSEPHENLYCLWVSELVLTISHTSPDIFVARDYPKGSCPYRAILAHEREHIRISRKTINRFLPRLRMTLTSLRIPTGLRPLLVDSRAQGEQQVRELMTDLVEPLYAEIVDALNEAQAKLDSPASYRRVFARCSNW